MARLEVSAAVAVQRSIGRIFALGVKRPNIKGKIIANYFGRRYVGLLPHAAPPRTAAESPETIWQFWDNPPGRATPAIVGSCVAAAEKWRGPFLHKMLDMNSAADYSDLPGFVYDHLKNGRMIWAHFADLLRLNLLKNHGGIWTDATNFMTAPVPEYVEKADFFVFLTDRITHFPYSFMQNFFIRAKKGSYLNDTWLALCLEYWKSERKDIDYFQHQLMFKAMAARDGAAKMLFAEMPHVSEDETLQFVATDQFGPFDAAQWNRIRKTSFFQKLTYKSGRHTIADSAGYPGSFFDKICKGELI
jgi:hypothetical protein